ncbi:MAG: glucosaminidase domain-containing protein [Candidatus Krumholzibacteriota bacterium]|nr:glucosaminidase domain-containing protein [Candidatus Krumholzibacteriota bacterium]
MKKRNLILSGVIALIAIAIVFLIYKSEYKERDNIQREREPGKETDYTASFIPEDMTIEEKKNRFKHLMVPPVKSVFSQLEERYKRVTTKIKSGKEQKEIGKLKQEYKAETDKELMMALKPHPVSITLAQAAIESSWATSRFFFEARNVFGVWSFDPNEPRIAAGIKRGNKTVWIKKYDTLEASVKDYYRILGRSPAFKEFRELRIKTNDPFKLVKELENYSEKRDQYTKKLSSIIHYNNFTEYDN